jgi:site-specific DNA recombinase
MDDVASGRIDINCGLQGGPAYPAPWRTSPRSSRSLDAKGASFVSVTQQFNTTTSHGRLTLNVLLSFPVEREVTAERIRDKIAASKATMYVDGRQRAPGL